MNNSNQHNDNTSPPVPGESGNTSSAPTLTAFDWLDSVVDEMILASDRALDRRTRAQTAPHSAWLAGADHAGDAVAPLADSAILGQLVLGYSPMIDPRGGIIATRLTVVPMRADALLDGAALLHSISEVWPEGAGSVSLNVSSETLLVDLLRAQPAANVMIEVPAFLAGEPANVQALLELKARGNTLLLKGRPLRELPREVLPCFRWSIIDLADDRRIGHATPPRVQRSIPHVQSGVHTMEQLRQAFEHGAVAVLGWPIGDRSTDATRNALPDLQMVVEMINCIDRREPIEVLEQTLMRDPVLSFELIRHVNSARFGLQVETGSFRHAIMMLGYHELRRWLALLLGTAVDDQQLKPVNFAALRRGILMRELAPDHGDDETRSELFMCGVFSLLDCMFAKPIDVLIDALVVPERVRQALIERTGPFCPILDMARAIESEVPHDIRSAATALFLGPMEINRALLRALAMAAQLE